MSKHFFYELLHWRHSFDAIKNGNAFGVVITPPTLKLVPQVGQRTSLTFSCNKNLSQLYVCLKIVVILPVMKVFVSHHNLGGPSNCTDPRG